MIPRPGTLRQTEQSDLQNTLADGAGHTFNGSFAAVATPNLPVGTRPRLCQCLRVSLPANHAQPGSTDPADRARNSHTEPSRLASRRPLGRDLRDTRPQILTQCPRHRPPPSKWRLNQQPGNKPHHNRYSIPGCALVSVQRVAEACPAFRPLENALRKRLVVAFKGFGQAGSGGCMIDGHGVFAPE